MTNKKRFSRRNFVKRSIATGGVGIVAPVSFYNSDCPVNSIEAPGTIALNDVLTDYQQENEKYGFGLKSVEICDEEGWKIKRDSIIQRSRIMLGEIPVVNETPVNSKVLGENRCNGYKEKKVQFDSGTGDTITGFLLIPDGAAASSPRPGIMALHATGPGSKQTVGLVAKEGRCYGMELALRGYVVLAIDVISAGERIYPGYDAYYTDEFYKQFPQWSAMGKMIHDHKKGVDFLCQKEMVDSERIGCIGHSLGGYNSFFLQAFESRIKAAVSSCGLSPMGGTNSPYQFARNDWFVHFNPYFREFIRTGIIPCDMHEIMALCAPRPFFNYSARKDAVYCHSSDGNPDFDDWWQTMDKALNQVNGVYDIFGKTNNFIRAETNGDHDFPAEIRKQAYAWLDKHLGME
ncbi:hypothetical protein D1164_13980 [Mariniphaga sediminis]|uniref:Peptidase S9 prolyl oligopeptidase catalytic domain-containing protein n=1 Tax=Mariniphaga sediminis TaxID=1628158 RepID=A0A399CXJ6_9BACT|nr:prolyl oligopeptidase family serine peptidase [Mariniphaga sediminis]RIH64465.1 hypothetical protein D1164_13980 [Mariniphaga sediminis]